MSAPELVVAGNLLVDDIVTREGQTHMGEAGGGALYVTLAASLWDVRVGLVTRLANDYPTRALDRWRARAVDLEGVRTLDGPSLRSWLLYEPHGRQIVHQVGTANHTRVSPDIRDIPPRFLGASVVHICPTPFKDQRALVTALAESNAMLSLDPHETVRENNLDAWRELLASIDLFFLSHEELRLNEAATDPRAALRRLEAGERPSLIALKCAEEGGLLFDTGDARFAEWKSRATSVVDPTGAGDAFAGGFLAGWLRQEPLERALRRGVVSASFAIESWGPQALAAATPQSAQQRMHEWFGVEANA
jgi:sugar/nucleoside kinase (ribokinase family)